MNRRILTALFATIALMPLKSSACAVCMGDPNSQIAVASNAVLWTLLALVGFIFVGTAATAYYLYRHSK